MSEPIKCHSCGADNAAEMLDNEARCKYCGILLFERPFAQLNVFARTGTSATGNNTWSYVRNGIAFMVISSAFAAYLDFPDWFRSMWAMTIWFAIVPLFTLVWTFNLHPQKRIPMVILAILLANAIPYLVGLAISTPRRFFSDDAWGTAALFAGLSLLGFIMGALLNNFRKQLGKLIPWMKGEGKI